MCLKVQNDKKKLLLKLSKSPEYQKHSYHSLCPAYDLHAGEMLTIMDGR